MATSGPNQSGAVSEFDDGWAPWSNVGNAITFDQVYATTTIGEDLPEFSNFLDYTGFGTYDGVGAGDSVTQLLIEVAAKTAATGAPKIASAQLIIGGVTVGSSVGVSSLAFTSTESYKSFPVVNVSDFGVTLTGAQLNASDTGVRVQFRNQTTTEVLSVDACRITATYTPAPSFNPGRVKATNGIAGSGVF